MVLTVLSVVLQFANIRVARSSVFMSAQLFLQLLSLKLFQNTVYSWYLWICGSKETTIEETPHMIKLQSVQFCTDASFIFPTMLPSFY
jgi:hypothetical protein